jgi:hypothetical protein
VAHREVSPGLPREIFTSSIKIGHNKLLLTAYIGQNEGIILQYEAGDAEQ